MHGRVKDKNSSEQEKLVKQLVREKKLAAFEALKGRVLSKRSKGEFDREALELTGQLLLAGAADFYTLWNYRCEILKEICNPENCSPEEWEKIFREEIAFNEKCVFGNPKSYAIFNHRCWLFLNILPPTLVATLWPAELDFTNRMFAADERNFHSWDYRRWCINNWPEVISDQKPCWQAELDFSRRLIAKNMSNYSAWHYRSKLLQSRLDDVHWDSEFELANNALYTDPNDQSAWWYYNSLVEIVCPRLGEQLVSHDFMMEQLQSLRDLLALEPKNKHANLALIKVKHLVEPANADVTELISVYDTVAALDPMRRTYYEDMRSSCVVKGKVALLNPADTEMISLTDLGLTNVPFRSILATTFLHLKRLDLSRNRISHLGKDLSSLSQQLEELVLDHNELMQVSAIRNMVKLQNVSLCHNKLTLEKSLPSLAEMAKSCPALALVQLTDNPGLEQARAEISRQFSEKCHITF